MLHSPYIQRKRTYCYEKGNDEKSRRDLGYIEWDSELQCMEKDINVQWTFINDKVQEVIEKHIPTKKVKLQETGINANLEK